MFSPLSAGTPGEQPKFPTRQVLASYLLDCPCLSLTKSACTSGVQSCWFVLSEWIDGCRQHLRKNLTFGSSAALHSVALFSLSLSCVCLCAYVCVCLGNIRCLFFSRCYTHIEQLHTLHSLRKVTQVGVACCVDLKSGIDDLDGTQSYWPRDKRKKKKSVCWIVVLFLTS